MGLYGGFWRPYVSVAQRRANAARALPGRLKGETPSPVHIEGRKIAQSFWGNAWCEHLESHADYANRLPRGRTYVRNGSVVHLKVSKGQINALVQGSELYSVEISVTPLGRQPWKMLISRCAGQVSSVVELLQGRLPRKALEAIADPSAKLFPQPREFSFKCSCPDWASMCKHVAAVLYGVGARLDSRPELFFELRGVDWNELVTTGVVTGTLSRSPTEAETLGGADLGRLFGIELEAPVAPRVKAKRSRGAKKPKGPPTITSSELRGRGIPPSTIRSWLRSRVLLRTANPGLYQTTDMTEPRIAAWRAKSHR